MPELVPTKRLLFFRNIWVEPYSLQNIPEDQKINEIFYKQIEELSEKEFDMGVIEVIKKQERKQGMKQGMEKGMKQGMKQGMEKGMEEGAVQKSREVLESLILELKLTDQEAARIAGVDVDFARKVRKELNQK